MSLLKTILELNAKYQASKFISLVFAITFAFKLAFSGFSTALMETFSTVFYTLIVYVSVILMVDFKKQIFAEIVSTKKYQFKTYLTWLFLVEYLALYPFFKINVSGFLMAFMAGIVLTYFTVYYFKNIAMANSEKDDIKNNEENEDKDNQIIEE
jgi:hypothetical protein